MIVYRTGRHNERTIYMQMGPEPDRERDMQVGTMDTPELGRQVVEALNRVEEFEAAEQRPVDLGGDLPEVPPPGVSCNRVGTHNCAVAGAWRNHDHADDRP